MSGTERALLAAEQTRRRMLEADIDEVRRQRDEALAKMLELAKRGRQDMLLAHWRVLEAQRCRWEARWRARG